MSTITNTSKTIVQPALPLASSPAIPAAKDPLFSLSRNLLAEGWTNGPGAQRSVTEWAVHNVVSDILRTIVTPVAGTNQVSQRSVTAGEMLDVLNGTTQNLPGKVMPRPTADLVVERPASRLAKAGEATVSGVKPARARAAGLLSGFHLHDKANLNRFQKWALERGYAAFLTLGHDQRKMILAGKGVHPDSVIAVKAATK